MIKSVISRNLSGQSRKGLGTSVAALVGGNGRLRMMSMSMKVIFFKFVDGWHDVHARPVSW